MYHVYLRKVGDSEWLIFTEKPVSLFTAEKYKKDIPNNYSGIETMIAPPNSHYNPDN